TGMGLLLGEGEVAIFEAAVVLAILQRPGRGEDLERRTERPLGHGGGHARSERGALMAEEGVRVALFADGRGDGALASRPQRPDPADALLQRFVVGLDRVGEAEVVLGVFVRAADAGAAGEGG